MIACMLTSLKVVSIAAVDWDCTNRSAMRALSRDIRTRRSVRSPAGAERETGWVSTRRLEGAGLGEGVDGAGETGGAGGAALCSTYADTSSLVIRPPRPVPLIKPTSSSSRFAFAAAARAAGI